MTAARTLLLFVALGVGAARGGEFQVTVDRAPLSFDAVSPLERERILPGAARVLVVSTEARWALRLRATGPLSSGPGGPALPLSRLRFGLSGSAERSTVSLDDRTVLEDQPPTGPNGRLVTLDYALASEWGDPSLAIGEHYSTQLVFSLTAVGSDAPFVAPDPFSPDGDGVRDEATLQLPEGAPAGTRVEILDAQGRRVRSLPISEGARVAAWDGLDEAGAPAPEGSYAFALVRGEGEVLARPTARLARGLLQGSAAVDGEVIAETGPLAEVDLALRAVSGMVLGRTRSDASGHFAFTAVPAGMFSLEATRPLYLPFTGPLFSVAEGEAVTQTLRLVHNHSLSVGLVTSRPRAAPGERVPFELSVRAAGTAPVDDARVQLTLTDGLTLDPTSVKVDGAEAAFDPATGLALGTIGPGEQRRIALVATLGPTRSAQVASASVEGSALGNPVGAGPATAKVAPLAGELTGKGGIYGRVCWDLDHDGSCGQTEPSARAAVVFLEDGSYAQTDLRGRFHFAPVGPGRHALLAGPGPLELPQRAGGFPRLPRNGTSRVTTRVFAGQFVACDVALPASPDLDLTERATPSEDEGDVIDAPGPVRRAALPAQGPLAEEGELDAQGNLVGLHAPSPPPSATGLSPFPPEGSASEAYRDHPVTPEPGAVPALPSAETSPALVGVGEATWNLGLGALAGPAMRSSLEGRLAFVFQHDFDQRSRASVVVDTARDGRTDSLAALDPRGTYRAFGDDARVSMSTQEKLYVRLDLPWLYAQGGRMGALLTESELLHSERSFVGAQVGVDVGWAQARVFGGFSADPERLDELPGTDSIGPYALSGAPVLPGSEQVDLELRSEDGELHQRLRLARGTDYFLDLERGTIELARPLPSRSPSGEVSVLVVRYQIAGEQPLLSGLLAGGRLHLGSPARGIGLTALYQDRPEGSRLGLAADSVFTAGPLTLRTELGHLPGSDGRAIDRSAARARLSAALGRSIELFAFGSGQGARWDQDVRSRPLELSTLGPFGLLDSFGQSPLSIPILALAMGETSPFPFLLSEKPGELEAGLGLRADAGPVRGVTLARRQFGLAGSPSVDHAEVAARARLGSLQLYAAHQSRAQQDELLGAATALRSRTSVAGFQLALGPTLQELDYRHVTREEPGLGDALEQELAWRGRVTALAAFQPAWLVSQTWVHGPRADGVRQELAAGIESEPVAGVRAFAYARQLLAEGDGLQPGRGAFAGVQLTSSRNDHLLVRYDLQDLVGAASHRLSWDGALHLPADLVAESDGSMSFGLDDRFLRFSLAYAPTGPVRGLARAQQERHRVGGVDTDVRTASLDASWRLGRFRLDAKALLRAEQSATGESIAGLGGLATGVELGRSWDVVVGGRALTDARGPTAGGFVEGGFTLANALRLSAGVNLARRAEVFTIDRQNVGLYVNLTGSYGGPIAAAPPREEAPIAIPRVEAPVAPPASVAAAPARATSRTIRGLVFGDRNGNHRWDPTEPTYEHVAVVAGNARATTDADGRYVLSGLGPEIATLSIDPATLPLGVTVAIAAIAPAPAEQTIDLVLPRRSAPAPDATEVTVELPEGRVTAAVIDRARFPLAAWVAGLPLSAAEVASLEQLSQQLFADPSRRLIIYSHAQTLGPPAKALKRAASGASALKRYIQATQMIPAKKIAIEVVEAEPGTADPVGHVELWLVRAKR